MLVLIHDNDCDATFYQAFVECSSGAHLLKRYCRNVLDADPLTAWGGIDLERKESSWETIPVPRDT